MKLKLEHLAPYLPYGLQCIIPNHQEKGIMVLSKLSKYRCWLDIGGSIHLWQEQYIEKIKPILRPLSDLTKEIEHNGEKFVFSDVYLSNTTIKKILGQEYNTFNNFLNDVDYNSIQLLLKNHFDVFGLLDKGLAIDINTL